MSWFEIVQWCAGLTIEVLLIGAMWRKGIARRLPVFAAYLVWGLAIDLACLVVAYTRPDIYLDAYLLEFAVDTLFQFLVILALASSAFSTLPRGVARSVLLLLTILTAATGFALWRVTDGWALHSSFPITHLYTRMQLTASILRILLLLALGWIIQFFNNHFIPVGWGDRELQVATGMGFYSLVSVGVSLVHTYQVSSAVFHVMDEIASLSFVVSVLYWLVCFLRPDRAARAGKRLEEVLAAGSDSSSSLQRSFAGGGDAEWAARR